MTVLEQLQKMFGDKLNANVDDSTNTPANQVDNKPNEDDSKKGKDENQASNNQQQTVTKNDNKQGSKDEEATKMNIFGEGWFDPKTGKIDVSKITDKDVASQLAQVSQFITDSHNKVLIDTAFNTELKNYKTNVSEETLRKVIDFSGVKVDEAGKVTGVKEAIEGLKSKEASFFINNSKKVNSPLNEGFNPVTKKASNTGVDEITFADAVASRNAQ